MKLRAADLPSYRKTVYRHPEDNHYALQKRIQSRLTLCDFTERPTHFVMEIDASPKLEAWLIENEIAYVTSIFADEIFLYDEDSAFLLKVSFGNSNTLIIPIDYGFFTKTVAYSPYV